MRLTDYGPFVNQFVTGSATNSFTMLPDRCAKVKKIFITRPSANDIWVVTSQTKEIFRAPVDTVGNQHLLGQKSALYPNFNDIWRMYAKHFRTELCIPIPKGQTLTVNSVGGATADVDLYYEEYTEDTDIVAEINHPQGKHWHIPIFGRLPAATTALAENNCNATVRPSWCPDVFTGVAVPQGWKVNIFGQWYDAASVNTFSGAANHVSRTTYAYMLLNARRLWTHPAQNTGLNALSEDAAAGSANTVYKQVNNRFPPFDFTEANKTPWLQEVLPVGPGDVLTQGMNLTGDVTGGADYSHAYLAEFVEVFQTT